MRRSGVPTTPDPRIWIGLWTIYLFWGSTYLAMRVMVRTIPPVLGASARFLIAGGVVLAVVALRERHARRKAVAAGVERPHGGTLALDRRQVALLVGTGIFVPGIGNSFNTLAVSHATSVTVALLNAAVPLWVILLRRLMRDQVPLVTLLAVPIGFSGVAVLLLPGSHVGADGIGIAFALGAGLTWGIGSYASSRLLRGIDALVVIGVQMAVASVVQVCLGAGLGEFADLHPGTFSGESIAALVFLATIGGFVSYTAYSWLLQHAPVSQIATFAFVNPIVAVVLGRLILGEKLGWTGLIGAAVIVGSVGVTVKAESRLAVRPATS